MFPFHFPFLLVSGVTDAAFYYSVGSLVFPPVVSVR